ncbi:hypothetical protein FKP32DRAFT_1679791 [Trametes sanguinea]|nr:hypothetical protein FKP32DRAFT_1679791 [Trametes sanguinea]
MSTTDAAPHSLELHSGDAIPLVVAIAEMSKTNSDIELLSRKLDSSVREILEPLGFGFKPERWASEAGKLLFETNREYRLKARWDILQGARVISRMGVKHLVERIVASKRMANTVAKSFADLQDLSHNHGGFYGEFDLIYIVENIAKFEKGLQLVKEGVARAADSFNHWKTYFLVLDHTQSDVKEFIQTLYIVPPQGRDTRSAKPLLSRLAKLHDERLELSARARSIATKAYYMFALNQVSVVGANYELRDIHQRLEGQQSTVTDTLSEFEIYATAAASSPDTVVSWRYGEALSTDRLRRSGLEFKEILRILQDVEEVYEPLNEALRLVIANLKSKLAV